MMMADFPVDPGELRREFAEAVEGGGPLVVLPSDRWKARALDAEARLAAIAAHCRRRLNAPGRAGMSRAAAEHILGLAEGGGEDPDPSQERLSALLREWRSRG